ncbi:hypothetical protein Vadar_000948 [Vaccinium darrowii]|uniref:Uncharacterized protein n=1 Tax=Vaccinium darrowii TaxID=229202 RepID=A0ACB7Z0V0_9ERIC|nr:hypothetical protein Vadar_000948 [Vaccinium darrowii]
MAVPSEDGFSNLPNQIIHHIFSYLETNDIPRITGVSRKFRDVCNSSPYLDLEADFRASQNCKCEGFMDFVDRVLGQRNGVGVHRLRLSWFCNQPHYKSAAGPLIDNWLKYAAECNVQDLDIGVFPGYGELFVIPPCLSNCQSLRVLKLNLKGRGLVLQPASFASLVDLNLSNVELCPTFSGGNIGHWISTSCNFLQNLSLDNILCSEGKDMSISSSSLQHITIRGCKFQEAFKLSITSASLQHLTMSSCLFNEWCKVDVTAERLKTLTVDIVFSSHLHGLGHGALQFSIFAPSLLNFSWTGPAACYSDNLEHFWFLEEASISVKVPHNHQNKELVCDFLERLLHSVRYTQNLQLNSEIFTYYHQPGVFDNLKQLVVVVRHFDEDQDQTISPFISGLRNLWTLTIKLDDDDNAVVDPNVVALLWMRSQKYVAKNRKPRKLAFYFHEHVEEMDPRWNCNKLLKWIFEFEKALLGMIVYYRK